LLLEKKNLLIIIK